MTVIVDSTLLQVAGLAVATLGWVLSITSLVLVEWRVWYMESTSPGLACVGMWGVCTYQRSGNSNQVKSCYQYPYHDTFLPLDIRVSQHLLLAANILGLLGKTAIILALRNISMGIRPKNVTCSPFIVPGMLHITSSICITVIVVWNYYSVISMEGIPFPPSYNLPFKPDTQETGSAVLLAALAAFLMLLSGLFYLSYKFPRGNKVHPEV
ncbi:claudin-34 [Tupaia chinensis]|uniref:Claudin-22 n=1 Tax=Tupaia chinensis TaxID=246437 RepID=L8YER4_TUPCH|nr:claudin-34 [Tupaia chinensis]ELV12896.1 Claudin-22 [Tupaia chinensis]